MRFAAEDAWRLVLRACDKLPNFAEAETKRLGVGDEAQQRDRFRTIESQRLTLSSSSLPTHDRAPVPIVLVSGTHGGIAVAI